MTDFADYLRCRARDEIEAAAEAEAPDGVVAPDIHNAGALGWSVWIEWAGAMVSRESAIDYARRLDWSAVRRAAEDRLARAQGTHVAARIASAEWHGGRITTLYGAALSPRPVRGGTVLRSCEVVQHNGGGDDHGYAALILTASGELRLHGRGPWMARETAVNGWCREDRTRTFWELPDARVEALIGSTEAITVTADPGGRPFYHAMEWQRAVGRIERDVAAMRIRSAAA